MQTLFARLPTFLAGLGIVLAIYSNPAHCGSLIGDAVNTIAPGVGTKLDNLHDDVKKGIKPYGEIMDAGDNVAKETRVETIGPILAKMIIASREDALKAGASPLPSRLISRFQGYFPTPLLQRVRYRVGQGNELSLQANAFRFKDKDAIALDYVIVFRHADDASDNLYLWAHELGHVQQYACWGILDFAKRYVRDRDAVERQADEIADKYLQYKSGRSTKSSFLNHCSRKSTAPQNRLLNSGAVPYR